MGDRSNSERRRLLLRERERGGEEHEWICSPPEAIDPPRSVDVIEEGAVGLRARPAHARELEVGVKLGSVPAVRGRRAKGGEEGRRVTRGQLVDKIGNAIGEPRSHLPGDGREAGGCRGL